MSANQRLKGCLFLTDRKVVLVTGGSSGIGQGIAQVFAENGYDAAITYGSNAEGGEETRQYIEARGCRCEVYQASMQDLDVPARLIDRVHGDFGRLDAMICNANRDRRDSVLTLKPESLDFTMRSNFASYLLCAGAAARHMTRDKIEGSIIFITSTRSMRAYAEAAGYGGLKAAIMRACESIALDLAPHRIRVNCIAPGYTAVRRNRHAAAANPIESAIPLGSAGTPRDNGDLALFLCSDKASYITGASIRVDGGLILSGPPEGWAPAYVINPDWTRRHVEAAMYDTWRDKID
jgi:NAD(P)-dependent dehydrogenase (short-subunit alcohol dehydrogenase family)